MNPTPREQFPKVEPHPGHHAVPSSNSPPALLAIGSPVSLRKLVSFGTIFVVIQIAGSLGQRFLAAL